MLQDVMAFGGHSSSRVTVGPCKEAPAPRWKDRAQDMRRCPRVFLQKKMRAALQAAAHQSWGGGGGGCCHRSVTPQPYVGPWAAAVNRWQGCKNCLSVDDEASFGICACF